MKNDPVLQLTLFIVACFLGIAVVITAGVFLAIPVAVAYIGYLVFQYASSRPQPPAVTTEQLYDKTRAVYPTTDEYISAYLDRTIAEGDLPVFAITSQLAGIAQTLYEAESLQTLPVLVFPEGSIEEARYRDKLIRYQLKSADPAKTIQTFSNALFESFAAFRSHLPPLAKDARYIPPDVDPAPFTVPLIDVIPDVGKAIQDTVLPFFRNDARAIHLFDQLRDTLEENLQNAKEVEPANFKGAPRAAVATYLAQTPLPELFDTNIPFDIPISRMLEHAVLVAGSGHGKTQTLGALISRFLQQDDPPALVVVDSTGALVKKIETLALFNDRLKDRIVIIDPEHEPTPALNMFDVSNARMRGYSESMRASVETEIVQLFNYIFTSAQNDLTSRQGTVFSYVVRLVLSMPGSTIDTLRQVLEDDPKGGYANSRYRAAIDALDATAQDFFKNQYFELKGFREQIAQRVYGLVQVPAFQRMFATDNKVDFFDELQNRGSIIVVNTSESILKQDASTLFGRYIIARTRAAAFERTSIPQEKRRPTFLIIDEAAPYFDDTFDKLLTRVRQFKLGVCVAFQHMEQASEKLRSSIASNTSVKMAGGLGYADSRWLARDMETTPEFLKAQRRDSADPPQWTQLACYVRNFTPQAVSLTIPFYVLETLPQMTAAEHRALLDRNRMRVSSIKREADRPTQEPAAAPSPPPSAKADAPPPPPQSRPKRDDDAAPQWQ